MIIEWKEWKQYKEWKKKFPFKNEKKKRTGYISVKSRRYSLTLPKEKCVNIFTYKPNKREITAGHENTTSALSVDGGSIHKLLEGTAHRSSFQRRGLANWLDQFSNIPLFFSFPFLFFFLKILFTHSFRFAFNGVYIVVKNVFIFYFSTLSLEVWFLLHIVF